MARLPVVILVALSLVVLARGQAVRRGRQMVPPGDMYCPPGFQKLRGRHCYGFFSTLATWTEAMTYCESLNTDLLIIDSADENEAVSNWVQAKSTPDKTVWLAGHSMLGHWSWAHLGYGSWDALSYTSWASGQPATPPAQQDGTFQCLLAEAGQWKTAPCDQSHAFVCKFEIDGLVGPDGVIAG